MDTLHKKIAHTSLPAVWRLQAGDTKAAIDCCVLLHQWDQALQLAQQYNYPQAEGLLQQYAGHLLEKKKYLEAVELYRKVRGIA